MVKLSNRISNLFKHLPWIGNPLQDMEMHPLQLNLQKPQMISREGEHLQAGFFFLMTSQYVSFVNGMERAEQLIQHSQS